jgi:hypothetical protein
MNSIFTRGNKMKSIGSIVFVIAAAVFVGFLLSFPMMLLWNMALVPAVPVLSEVGWLQMWGIQILISLFLNPLKVSFK